MKKEGKSTVDIKRCFDILELDRSASLEDVKQAYKDIVNVWHPDRFSHHPRLKQRAEKKLKEANLAFETVVSYLAATTKGGPEKKAAPGEASRARGEAKDEMRHSKVHTEAGERDRTEVVVEAGTRFVLTACFQLYSTLRRFVVSQAQKLESAETDHKPSHGKGDKH
jgi:curved DNA-binding protein CbpA